MRELNEEVDRLLQDKSSAQDSISVVLQQNKHSSVTGIVDAICEREARRQETSTAKVTSLFRNLYPMAKLTAGFAKDIGGGTLPAAGAVGAGLGCLFDLLMKPHAQTEVILDSLQRMSGSTRLLESLHDVPIRDLHVDVLLAALHLSTALTSFLGESLVWLDKSALAKFGSVAFTEDRLKGSCADVSKARQDLNEAMQHEAFFMAKQSNLEAQQTNLLAKICPANEHDFHLAKQVLLRDRRLPGTGTLFLDQEPYANFRGGETRLLWCTGLPGAGKTYIASAIIDDLEIYARHRDVGLAYVFFERGREQLQDVNSPIAALTWQLMARKPELLSTSKQFLGYNRMSNLQRRELFCQACSDFEQIFLVVDALDELSTEVKVLHELIKHLVSLVADASPSSTIKICLTSRENPSIWSMVENALSVAKKSAERVEFCASEDDIRTLVETEAEQNPNFLFCESQDALLRSDFVQHVVKRSGRMIGRISDLSLGSVEFNGRSSNDVQEITDRADVGWRGSAPRRKYRVFDHVVTAAHETSQMAQLLLMDAHPDIDYHQHHQILLRLALEHADAPTSRVLLQEGAVNVNEPSCHTGVTPLGLLLRPLTYLNSSMDETKRIFATIDVVLAHSQLEINTQDVRTGEGAVHFVPRVAGMAALQLLDRLVRAGVDIYNATAFHGTTVLMLSSWLGRADVVAKLLELNDSRADAVDVCKKTALHYACIPVRYRESTWECDNASQYRDCRMVLDLLCERALDINARDSFGRTPLAWACLCTKANVIAAKKATMEARWAREQLWPDAGIDDLYDHTLPDSDAFQVAVASLLDAGADPNINDKAGHSPLDHANAMLDLADKRLACALKLLRMGWDPEIAETHLPLSYGAWVALFDHPDTPSVDGIMLDSVDLDLFLPARALRQIIELLKSQGARASNPLGSYRTRWLCQQASRAAQQNHGTSKLAAAQGGAVAVANYSQQQQQQAGPGAPPPGGQQAGGYPGKPSYQAYPGGAA
ncbi:hypothetical protein KC331_g10764, partial [Hortaea werneckii]